MVSFENLQKSYGGVQAVNGLTFQIFRGEFFGLLGPNGAGKTTTIGMLCGLLEPSSGKVIIDGHDLLPSPRLIKARLGLVPQDFAFYPTLSARDNLRFFGRLYGLRERPLEKRINAVLDLVQLTDRVKATVKTFSNGMKRRLNIAIGLLHEPQILVLDEPTAGVDAQSRSAILGSMESLNKTGITILYTTHYIEEAQRFCSRVAIMDQGRIIALDTPPALIRNFGEGLIHVEFNARLDDSLLGQLQRIGKVQIMDNLRTQIHLETKDGATALREMVDLSGKLNLQLRRWDVLEPNLETVFLHLTGRHLRD